MFDSQALQLQNETLAQDREVKAKTETKTAAAISKGGVKGRKQQAGSITTQQAESGSQQVARSKSSYEYGRLYGEAQCVLHGQ
jgi:hypothetical protein